MSGVAGMGPEGQGAYDKTNDAIRVTPITGTGGTAPAAAADATANPTAGSDLAFIHSFNGTTWDRVRSAVTTVSATLTGFLNTLPWALFHTAPVTRTNGQGGPLETDATGNLRTTEQFLPASNFTYISTATTTVVKSGAGRLARIIIGTPIVSATITVYDNTAASGTVIATLSIGSVITGDQPDPIEFGCAFATGLTIVTSGATLVTVIWD